jgi:prepilin-type N-terminal cleavage/methylation domain-containing protein
MRRAGFGLIELMISLVVVTIIMIGAYTAFIKSMRSSEKSTAISLMRNRAQVAFELIASDLKEIGSNPKGEVDANNTPLYRITYHPGPLEPSNPKPYDSIAYTFLNTDAACTTFDPLCAADTGNDGKLDLNCRCRQYMVENGTVLRRTYDLATSNVTETPIVNNACLRIMFCNSKLKGTACSDSTCYCCSGLPSECACANQAAGQKPKMAKLILAVLPNEEHLADFDCACRNTALDKSAYIRLENNVYLSNLK